MALLTLQFDMGDTSLTDTLDDLFDKAMRRRMRSRAYQHHQVERGLHERLRLAFHEYLTDTLLHLALGDLLEGSGRLEATPMEGGYWVGVDFWRTAQAHATELAPAADKALTQVFRDQDKRDLDRGIRSVRRDSRSNPAGDEGPYEDRLYETFTEGAGAGQIRWGHLSEREIRQIHQQAIDSGDTETARKAQIQLRRAVQDRTLREQGGALEYLPSKRRY